MAKCAPAECRVSFHRHDGSTGWKNAKLVLRVLRMLFYFSPVRYQSLMTANAHENLHAGHADNSSLYGVALQLLSRLDAEANLIG